MRRGNEDVGLLSTKNRSSSEKNRTCHLAALRDGDSVGGGVSMVEVVVVVCARAGQQDGTTLAFRGIFWGWDWLGPQQESPRPRPRPDQTWAVEGRGGRRWRGKSLGRRVSHHHCKAKGSLTWNLVAGKRMKHSQTSAFLLSDTFPGGGTSVGDSAHAMVYPPTTGRLPRGGGF